MKAEPKVASYNGRDFISKIATGYGVSEPVFFNSGSYFLESSSHLAETITKKIKKIKQLSQ
jgi:hypothetical protein